MLDNIKQYCVDYYDELPIDTFQSVGRSACVSFVVTMVISGGIINPTKIKEETFHFSQGIAAGLIAGTASLVHALTTPLFHKIFGDREIKFERELLKIVCNLSLTYMILNPFTPLKHHLAQMLFARSFPPNIFKAQIHLLPRFFDLFDSQAADEMRHVMDQFGLGVNPDENSAYYTFGF